MASTQGQLLIATPQLADPNFYRTVVLMIQHSSQGAFGVVLNRRSSKTIREIWDQIGETCCATDQTLDLGGPVTGPLLALHTVEEDAEMEVIDGLFVASSKDKLLRIVAQHERPFRIFSGYAGWGEGQLERELEAGAWLRLPANHEHIFGSDEDLWRKVGKDIAGSVLKAALGNRQPPPDPSYN